MHNFEISELEINTKLTWQEIEKIYDSEWIELVDFDWPESQPRPLTGIVRTHNPDKKKFHQGCRRQPAPKLSAFLFVGKRPRTGLGNKVTVFSPSNIRISPR